MEKWELIGYIDVDAGIVSIGDPCYQSDGRNTYENWSSFCEKYLEKFKEGHVLIPHDLGHEGKAIIVETTYGDGSYPVYTLKNKDGRIKSVRIDFDGEE